MERHSPLPPPEPRTLLHTRQLVYYGWQRHDGLWDIEGELLDTKSYELRLSPDRSPVAPGQPIHKMKVRVVVDNALKVIEAHVEMAATPFAECLQAQAPAHLLAGATLAKGWRKAVDATMGDTQGCAHVRELLYGIGTAAYQTLSAVPRDAADETQPPRHLGHCIAWDFSGAVTQRLAPQFYKPKEGTLDPSELRE